MRRSLLALIALLFIAACGTGTNPDAPTGDDDSPAASPPDPDAPVLVIADDSAVDGPGITVAEALTHGPSDDMVLVNGSLFIDADGTVRLCDAIAESFPPQCGGDRIVVQGLQPDDVEGLQTEGDVSWADAVTLFGSVE